MARTEFYYNRGNRPLEQGTIIGVTQDQINFSGSGDQTLVAAIPGRKIHLLKLLVMGSAASNVRFWSGASADNAPISGQMNFAGPWSLALDNDDFSIVTDAGDALILASSAVIQVGGWIKYCVV